MALTIVGILAFGTPTFVFISELILSRSYPDRLPGSFFKKRVLPILLPFVFISFFNSFVPNYNNIPLLLKDFTYNLLGSIHGPWFILVILQFYILHRLFIKYLSKVSAPIILTGSFIINLAYLAFFNLSSPPNDSVVYLWEGGYWVPCIGWLFYFALAYYCGKNYQRFIQMLKAHPVIVLTTPVIALGIVLYVNTFDVMPYGSKRMDMVVFTVTMILALFLAFTRLKRQPAILGFVSKYSFGIYLLHFFFMRATNKALGVVGIYLGGYGVAMLFISSVIASIVTVHIVNKHPLGKYLVGGIRTTRSYKEPGAFVGDNYKALLKGGMIK
jgi:membrane-bound acyltransferase YfiQ involved in biofilm formation